VLDGGEAKRIGYSARVEAPSGSVDAARKLPPRRPRPALRVRRAGEPRTKTPEGGRARGGAADVAQIGGESTRHPPSTENSVTRRAITWFPRRGPWSLPRDSRAPPSK
jgi:hypothetical protein